jgi:hypothetical protein
MDPVHRARRQRPAVTARVALTRRQLCTAPVVQLAWRAPASLALTAGTVLGTGSRRAPTTLAAASAGTELRVEDVEGVRADPCPVDVAQRAEVAIHNPAVLLQGRRRPATRLVLDPLLAELAEGAAPTREPTIRELGRPGDRLTSGISLVSGVDDLGLVAVPPHQWVASDGDPQLPATRRQPTNTPHAL